MKQKLAQLEIENCTKKAKEEDAIDDWSSKGHQIRNELEYASCH